jgi:hypothetical protein
MLSRKLGSPRGSTSSSAVAFAAAVDLREDPNRLKFTVSVARLTLSMVGAAPESAATARMTPPIVRGHEEIIAAGSSGQDAVRHYGRSTQRLWASSQRL